MVRLFKGMTRIIKDHMQLSDEVLKANATNKSATLSDLKKGSIAYAEYREFCHLISKLVETSELFLDVNQDLVHRENMKRGLGKGSWRSSK